MDKKHRRTNFKNKLGTGLYMQNVITKSICIPFKSLGRNILELLQETIVNNYEQSCIKEGYIKANSIRILNYSSGRISGENVLFNVNFECLVCKPVEGMIFKGIVKNITKAGLKCQTSEDITPIIAFVARDHHYQNIHFQKIKVDDEISIKVIGIRFELNDKYISVIGELVESKKKVPRAKIIIKKKT
jgi:DNA-directed RNA polymerase subunit E'/Rpb7|tara:strand:+ start:263 stop:826 length:564 start_codon:yes stop_codon:yes gene_type:complete